jgi:hypothetical protein
VAGAPAGAGVRGEVRAQPAPKRVADDKSPPDKAFMLG